MQDVFFDTNVIWEALRTTNYYSILKQNKEFEEWQKTEEADKCTKREYLQKILSIMPKEIIEQVEQYIEHKKAQNKPMLELIESLYKKSSEKSYVKPIEFADGYAILEDRKVLLHNTPLPEDITEMESRKELGFLASEWFGKLENMHEDAFCCSFTKHKGLKPQSLDDEFQPYFDIDEFKDVEPEPIITFIFDAECESLKPLLRLDLFQYCRNKKDNNLSKYTQQEIELLEYLLKWSPSAMSVAESQPTWSAIPGGVQSNMVIGVMMKHVKENSKEYEMALKIADLFNVPLFKRDLSVVNINNWSK